MGEIEDSTGTILMAARERGRRAVSATAIPAGLDHFTVYVGLIGSALELGKLVATQKRDLKVIDSHYEIEASKIDTAMREVEAAMSADFRRDRSLRKRTFESINMLIAAGQHEIALKFYERLLDGFTRGALEGLIALRNHVAVESGTRLRLK